MSYWIESHQSLSSHLKLLNAADDLGMLPAHVEGHLHQFWHWALDNASVDGVLPPKLRPAMIARAAGWPVEQLGPAEKLVTAWLENGWLEVNEDGCYVIHDWYTYAGKLTGRRAANATRMREARARGEDVDDEDTDGDLGDPVDVPEARGRRRSMPSTPRATHVRSTWPARAVATGPDRTGPTGAAATAAAAPGSAHVRTREGADDPVGRPLAEEETTTVRPLPRVRGGENLPPDKAVEDRLYRAVYGFTPDELAAGSAEEVEVAPVPQLPRPREVPADQAELEQRAFAERVRAAVVSQTMTKAEASAAAERELLMAAQLKAERGSVELPPEVLEEHERRMEVERRKREERAQERADEKAREVA